MAAIVTRDGFRHDGASDPERTFLATLDDPAARMVYADWLEQRGDVARASFVRERWDERIALAVALPFSLVMFHVNHYYAAYWQAARKHTGSLDVPFPAMFPKEVAILELAIELSGQAAPRFALITTEYFDITGGQVACMFEGARRITAPDARINDALRLLGVIRADGRDEFDTVGLANHRRSPPYLGHYRALCRQLGV
jgi:uncharacterized protein (TIGR02996 family)